MMFKVSRLLQEYDADNAYVADAQNARDAHYAIRARLYQQNVERKLRFSRIKHINSLTLTMN